MKQWEAAKAARDAERKKQKEEAELAAYRKKQEEAKRKEEEEKVLPDASCHDMCTHEVVAALYDACCSWPSCRERVLRRKTPGNPKGKAVLGPKPPQWRYRPPSSGDICAASDLSR